MKAADLMRTITAVQGLPPSTLRLTWSDGATVTLDLAPILDSPAFKALRDPAVFARVEIGDWGHSVQWPTGDELGADSLWLETLSAQGLDDTRRFLEWRLRHGLSLTKAAEALGLSRRMVAYYANGEKRVPRHIALACLGWEVERPYPVADRVGQGVHGAVREVGPDTSRSRR